MTRRFERDVCFQFAVFAIESFMLGVPLDTDEPSYVQTQKARGYAGLDRDPNSRYAQKELDITQTEGGVPPTQDTLAHLSISSRFFSNTLD